MSTSLPQRHVADMNDDDIADINVDLRVLFLGDSDLDTRTDQRETDSISSHSTSIPSRSSSSISTGPLPTLSAVDDLHDLELLLTRINLVTGRNTPHCYHKTHRSTHNDSIMSRKKTSRQSRSKSVRNLPSKTSVQTISWDAIPDEICLRIYYHYFNNTHYTIHDSSPKTNCLTRPKSIAWKNTVSNSRKVHSSHINLFLTRRNIIYAAHPIWLATSTFSFGLCVMQEPKLGLYRMKTPDSIFAQIKTFEVSQCDVEELIAALGVWKGRLGSADGSGGEVPFALRYKGPKSDFNSLKVSRRLSSEGLLGMKVEHIKVSRGRKQERLRIGNYLLQ